MKFSLIITVSGRLDHLKNQLKGVKSCIVAPSEIIIVAINEPELMLGEFSELPIQIIRLEGDQKKLPIAKARNRGVRGAKYDSLFFLDVDCIPDETYFDEMASYINDNRVLMGTPYYLPKGEPPIVDFTKAISHPHRPEITQSRSEIDFNLFWSLCFAMTRKCFDNVGGFDENFLGYGGEDTDFAWSLRDAGMEFWLVTARVYHQQHPVSIPPLGHLQAIVNNSNYFFTKRGVWIMENWLEAFTIMGLIDWNQKSTEIRLIRQPTEEQMTTAYREDAVFM